MQIGWQRGAVHHPADTDGTCLPALGVVTLNMPFSLNFFSCCHHASAPKYAATSPPDYHSQHSAVQ
jgi:hypothetical protein